jgi:hypothetical protein
MATDARGEDWRMTPYLRRPLTSAATTGHRWELDARTGGKRCVRCGEMFWDGPMRDCTKAEKAEGKR